MITTILSVALAVAVPLLWGLASAWAFDEWRARRECGIATVAAPDEGDLENEGDLVA